LAERLKRRVARSDPDQIPGLARRLSAAVTLVREHASQPVGATNQFQTSGRAMNRKRYPRSGPACLAEQIGPDDYLMKKA